MIETYGWWAVAAGAVGLAGLLLLLVPPPQRAVRAWLSQSELRGDDETVIAVRAALLRMCYVGGAVFFVLTVVGLVAQLRAVAAALALAFAAVAAASVRMESGTRRRAGLVPLDVSGAWSRRVMIGATGLAVVVVIVAVVLAVRHARGTGISATLALESGVLPAVEHYTLPLLAGASALLAAMAWLGYRRVLRRQSLAGVDAHVDHALRGMSTRRIAGGALGGQLVLLGTALAGTPLLAPRTGDGEGLDWQSNLELVTTARAVALVVITVGLVVVSASLLASFRTGATHRARLADVTRA